MGIPGIYVSLCVAVEQELSRFKKRIKVCHWSRLRIGLDPADYHLSGKVFFFLYSSTACMNFIVICNALPGLTLEHLILPHLAVTWWKCSKGQCQRKSNNRTVGCNINFNSTKNWAIHFSLTSHFFFRLKSQGHVQQLLAMSSAYFSLCLQPILVLNSYLPLCSCNFN